MKQLRFGEQAKEVDKQEVKDGWIASLELGLDLSVQWLQVTEPQTLLWVGLEVQVGFLASKNHSEEGHTSRNGKGKRIAIYVK